MFKLNYCFLLILLIYPFFAQAQSIRNPSFETINPAIQGCPTRNYPLAGTFNGADWESRPKVYTNNTNTALGDATVDYYHTCAGVGGSAYPKNEPPRTGNAYAGILSDIPTNYYAEYLFQTLSTPLIKGRSYYIEFWVSLEFGVPANSIGMFLTNNEAIINTPKPIGSWNFFELYPQVQIPNNFSSAPVYSNTNGWTKISGFYTPTTDNVRYILIGNFARTASSYFIDDVSITEVFPHLNLIGIQKNGTSSGKVEIHTATGSSGLQDLVNSRSTAFASSTTDWEHEVVDYDKDGSLDLVGIKKTNTGTGRTEIHVVRASNNFSQITDSRGTAFPLTDANWEFKMADWERDGKLDLIGIRTYNTGYNGVEIHVASGASDYSQFIFQKTTAFLPSPSGWEYKIADYDNDNRLDLIGIKKSNTGTASTEIHVARASNDFSQITDSRGTAFPLTDANWEFEIIDNDNDRKLDIIGIKKTNTGTGKTEVHLALGASNYTQLIGQVGTGFPQTDSNWEFAMPDTDSNISGGRKATINSPATTSISTDELAASISYQIFPNPAADMLNIVFAENYLTAQGSVIVEAKLYNSHRLILKTNQVIDNKIALPVQELPSGLYYLNIQVGQQVIKKHIQIMH